MSNSNTAFNIGHHYMYEIDRIAVVIKPTEQCLAWVNALPATQTPFNLEDIQEECVTLLIPYFEDLEDAYEYVADLYESIFENELASWTDDETAWPKRDYETFCEWFQIECHSMVYDIASLTENMETEETSPTEILAIEE